MRPGFQSSANDHRNPKIEISKGFQSHTNRLVKLQSSKLQAESDSYLARSFTGRPSSRPHRGRLVRVLRFHRNAHFGSFFFESQCAKQYERCVK